MNKTRQITLRWRYALAFLLALLALLSAPSARAQVPQAISIAVGADSLTRLLWDNANGTVSLWHPNADGSAADISFGPYAGWHGVSVALGTNDVPRILWNLTNGETSIYWVNEVSGTQTNRVYGPYTGWTAQGLGIGNDNVPRLLWNHTADNQMALWSINDANGAFTSIPYGPYTSYVASLIAVGPNNQPRILWNKTDGSISLWNVSASSNTFTSQTYGPFAGYTPVAMAVGADNQARILWTHPADSTVLVWTVTASGTYTGQSYPVPSGYAPKGVAAGPDGSTRLLWAKTDGSALLWTLPTSGTLPSPSIVSVSVSPSPVVAGTAATGTVTLSAAAPTGGTTVTLTASQASVAVPASVTVPAGATTATFALSTTEAGAGKYVYLSASSSATALTPLRLICPPPVGLTATPGAGSVALSWAAMPGASGYYVKRGTVSGGPYPTVVAVGTGATYTDSTVTSGTPYFYLVTAVGPNGTESVASDEAMGMPYTSPAAPSVTPAYGYTSDDLRAWKTVSGQTTYFLYDGGAPLCELDGTGAVTATNTWGSGGLLSRRVASTSTVYAFDPSGNVAQRTSSTGSVLGTYLFDAFGLRTGTDSTTDPYSGFGGQFGGYTDSESGLTLLSHRYYDSGTGRFLTRDPIGYAGGMNLYAYAGNNPIMCADPSGFCPGVLSGIDWSSGPTFLVGEGAGMGNLLTGIVFRTSTGQPWHPFSGGTSEAGQDGATFGGGLAFGATFFTGGGEAAILEEGTVAAGAGEAGPVSNILKGGPPSNCFVMGTLVQMADGSTKPIEEVKAGDLVMTKDQSDAVQHNKDGSLSNVSSQKVVRTFVHEHAKTLTLSLENGEVITTTFGHPFFVEGEGWKLSGHLALGNAIVTRAGPAVKIVGIKAGAEATVYNFEVQGTHTYFVGRTDGGLWVHNASMFTATLTSESGEVLGTGISTPPQPLTPFLQELVERAKLNPGNSANPGGCAEINAILNSGLSKEELIGKIMTVVRRTNPERVGTPCDVCQQVLDWLEITVTPGTPW